MRSLGDWQLVMGGVISNKWAAVTDKQDKLLGVGELISRAWQL